MGPNNMNQNPNLPRAVQAPANNFNVTPNAEPPSAGNVDPALVGRVAEALNQLPNNYNQMPAPQEKAPEPTMPVTAGSASQAPQEPVAVATTASSSSDDKPVDAETLEKIWVDKAKSTIERTKMDPHEEAHQVAELTAEYLKTRYGKIIGK